METTGPDHRGSHDASGWDMHIPGYIYFAPHPPIWPAGAIFWSVPIDEGKVRVFTCATFDTDRFEWRKHVLKRLAERSIPQKAVLEVLRSGQEIEDYPHDHPYPSALFLGWFTGKPLHVVAALDTPGNWAYIITTYEPDFEHFEAGYATRRRS